jgi:iron complex outermembrane receptor protein
MDGLKRIARMSGPVVSVKGAALACGLEGARKMNQRLGIRGRGVTFALFVLLFALHTSAMSRAADLRTQHRFNIPAQSLDTALLAFSDQAKVQVLMWAESQSATRSRGAVGELTAVSALEAILRDTGLQFKEVDSVTVAIFSPTSNAARVNLARAGQDAPGVPAPADAPAARGANTQTTPASVPAPASDDRDATLQEVVVTGSSIRGVSPTGSSLSEVTRADIVATGAATTTEVLRSVPQLASFNATGINGGQDQANFVDQPAIHGIGVGNGGGGLTLVLVDGRRLPGAGINQTAPDPGAIPPSAIERVEVVADGASSIYGSDAVAGVINFVLRKNFDGAETAGKAGYGADYRSYNFSQLLGKTWENGSAMLVYEYSGNTALNGTDRSYYGDNQAAQGAGDNRSTLCNPANVTVGGATYALSGSGASTGVLNRCENNVFSDLYPNQHRNQGMISLRRDFSENIEGFISSIYSDREVRNREAASGASNSKGGLSVTVTGGPYYDFVTGLGVPGGGQPHAVTYNPANDIGTDFRNSIRARTSSSVAGVNISFGRDWVASVQGNYGEERDDISQYGMNQALALAAAAAGTLNPYGVGPATSAAVLDAIGNYETRYKGKQTVTEGLIKVDGTVMDIPAGPLKAAVGVTAREEQFIAGFREGPVGGPDALPAVRSVGKREIRSAFGELYIPLIGGRLARPGMQSVELSLSARYDDYDDVGNTTNPKIGINWTLFEGLLLRASYGQSFHAPSLADAPTAIDTRVIRFPDFTGSSDPNAYSVILAGGNTLRPETADTYSAGFDWQPQFVDALKVNATYWKVKYQDVITFPTFGPVSEPDNPIYDPYRIYNPTLNDVVTQTTGFRHDGLLYPDIPALPTAIYDLRRQNFAEQNIDGIDFGVTYRLNDWLFGAAGTRILTFDQQVTGDSVVTSRLDTNTAVKMRVRGSIGWQRGNLNASGFLNYTDGYRNTATDERVGSFTTLDFHVGWDVNGAGILSDLQVTFDGSNILDEDPPFYYDPTSNSNQRGYDATVASALGRVYSVGFRKSF